MRRLLTESELRWWTRVRKVMQDMPPTVELSVPDGGVLELHERGAMWKSCEQHGHADTVPTLDQFKVGRLYPRSETL